jgi:hypothetical protein
MQVLVLLVLFVAVPLLIRLFTWSQEGHRARRELIDVLRSRVLGPSETTEVEGVTQLRFVVDGRPARLTLPEAEGRTVLAVGEPDAGSDRLHVFQAGGHGLDSRKEDRRVGDAAFDRDWVVQGAAAERIFSPEWRAESIAAIQALRAFYDPCVEMYGGTLRVGVGQAVDSHEPVRALLRVARTLHGALTPPDLTGLLWIESRDDAPLPVCQICGMSEGGGTVRCVRCRTPHHAECWTYAGRCSTYGCGSRERC